MVVFCRSGFFSIVRHESKEDMLTVRSERREDLEKMCKRLADDEHTGIEEIKGIATPLKYETSMSYRTWEFFLKRESDAIDYTASDVLACNAEQRKAG